MSECKAKDDLIECSELLNTLGDVLAEATLEIQRLQDINRKLKLRLSELCPRGDAHPVDCGCYYCRPIV